MITVAFDRIQNVPDIIPQLRRNATRANYRHMPEDAPPFKATVEQPARRLGGVTGYGFVPGRSGNPAGRPKGIEALARERTAEAIAALVEHSVAPRERCRRPLRC